MSITWNLDARLILRQYKLDLMSRYMEMKRDVPKENQKNGEALGYSESTVNNYRDQKKASLLKQKEN